jgi:serine/threonine-protein kinase RsbW
MERRLALLVSPALENVGLVAAAVRGMCRESLDAEGAARVELALVEACTNAIRHGRDGERGETFRLEVRVTEDWIEFVLAEPGDAYDFDGREMPAIHAGALESLPEGGFGIPLIKAVMDVAEYRRIGDTNVLRLAKRRGGARGPQSR